MRKVFIISVFALMTTFSYAQLQKINWVSFEEALELQKKNPKKIMMDVYTSWCGPCKMLDRQTFQNQDVVNYVNENYYAVKFNGEGNVTVDYDGQSFGNPNYKPELANRRNSAHELTRYLRVSAYPTIVFFGEDSKVIFPVRGFKQPQDLELYLKLFNEDAHKTMKTQEDFTAYAEAFKPEFRQ